MGRSTALVLLAVCLTASWASAHFQNQDDNVVEVVAEQFDKFEDNQVVSVDDESNDVIPRAVLAEDFAREKAVAWVAWPWWTTPRSQSTPRRSSNRALAWSTSPRPNTTPRWPTTTRRPYTTTRRPYTTTRRIPTTTHNPNDQSLTIGGVYPYDRQLETKTVYKSATWLTVHTEYLNFSSPSTIHCIQIVDLQKNGKNAGVAVQSGGIGQRNVQLKFKSQRGEKINYLVIIWGQ